MKNLIYILNMLMILIFASCKDENAFMPGDDGLTCYSILVSAPNNATRAVYEESGENIAVKWEKGDVIDVDGKQFVYKEDRENNAALFVLYAESMPDVAGKEVRFGEADGVQIQSKNNKCHEVLVGTVPAGYNFTNPAEVIPLLPETGKSLLHIQTKSPAMFMGQSLLKINGLATEYTIQLGENPELVFADKNDLLDIYVTVATGTIGSGKTLKFYFYAYDKNTPADLTHGDEYHYYMKCNASIAMENDKVVKMPLPNRPTHTAIQMGLSVKWATMNIGATSDQPGEASFGGYYPWGETQPITAPKGANQTDCYLYGRDNAALTEIFGNSDIQGITKTINGVVYGDAATESWGDDWMLPNMTQMDELVDCVPELVGTGWVEWQTTNVPHIKTNGRYFKGKAPYSEKKIWLPAAGGVHTQKRVADQVASNDGCNGVYMTSIPARTDGFNNMSFNGTQVAKSGSWSGPYDFYRHHGVSVRPVRKLE